MRNLVYAINLTLDGCCDHTKFSGTDEILEYNLQLLRDADTFLFGRVTYQLMVPYWPDIAKNHDGQTKSDIEFAQAFEAIKNIVVFSKTLDKAEEKNTRILRNNLKEEVLKLKQGEGKNILVSGVDIPSQLVQLGLVDEFHFIIQPVLVGEGRRLFDRVMLKARSGLNLVDSMIFPSGCVALHYVKS